VQFQYSAKPLFQLLLFLAVGVGFPATLFRSTAVADALNLKEPPSAKLTRVMPASGGVQDAASGHAILLKHQPAWVLVGNSMLNGRVTGEYLEEISGQQLYKLSISATKSAMWYLMLKRIVAESQVKPRCVTVFFKDLDLTWPAQKLRGMHQMIDRLDGRQLPEWRQVMSPYDSALNHPFTSLSKRVGDEINGWLPANKFQLWARGKLQKTAMNLTEFGPHKQSYKQRKAEINTMTGMNSLRKDVRTSAQPQEGTPLEYVEPTRFDASQDASFLPHMVALAKKEGFVLHLHRIKINPSMHLEPSGTGIIHQYLAQLRDYAEKEGCLYTDETDIEGISADMFVDDVHLREQPEIQQRYMRLFWKQVAPQLTPVLAPARKEGISP
jgi:hypothetical protein